jgi:hypothetical protein
MFQNITGVAGGSLKAQFTILEDDKRTISVANKTMMKLYYVWIVSAKWIVMLYLSGFINPHSKYSNVYFNPSKMKLVYILFKNSVRTSKRTRHFTITKINWLTLFKFNPLKPREREKDR